MYHEPIIHHKDTFFGRSVLKPIFKYSYKKDKGQFLLGDINLTSDERYEKFKNYYRVYLKRSFLLQIPHHGSPYNWRKSFLDDCSSDYWLITACKNNKHGHPSKDIIADIWANGKYPIWIHEEWVEDRLLIKQFIQHWRKY